MSLRQREVIALLFALYGTWFSIGIYGLFLQLYAFYVIGATNLLVSLLATVYFASNAPASIIGGYLIDKYGKAKLLLLLSLALLAVSNFITPLIKDGYYLLFIRVLQGCSTAIIIPLVNLVGARLMGTGRGVGTVNMFGALGFATAGIIGGFLADYISYIPLFYMSGLIVALGFLNMVFLPKDAYNSVGAERIRISYLKRISISIWIIYIAFFLRYVAAGGIWSLFSLFVFTIGGNNFYVGILQAINTITQVLIFRKVGELSEGRGLQVFKIGILLSVIVFISYYFSTNVIQILPFQVILGVSWVAIYAGANVYIIENTPKEIQGTALGLLNMVNALSWIIGSAVNGYLSDIYYDYRVYILLGIIISFLGYLLVEVYYHIRRESI